MFLPPYKITRLFQFLINLVFSHFKDICHINAHEIKINQETLKYQNNFLDNKNSYGITEKIGTLTTHVHYMDIPGISLIK